MAELTVVEGGGEAVSPVTRRRRAAGYCAHRQAELDGTARRVYCSACKDELDAWDVLNQFAYEYDRWVAARDRVKAEAQAAAEQLDDLKRQIRNAKATLRRRAS